jgi:hypothetical protein
MSRPFDMPMPTLLLSTRSLPAAAALAGAAEQVGWSVAVLDENPACAPGNNIVYYGGSDVVLAAARRFHLTLLEPPLDLLARLPLAFRQRAVDTPGSTNCAASRLPPS